MKTWTGASGLWLVLLLCAAGFSHAGVTGPEQPSAWGGVQEEAQPQEAAEDRAVGHRQPPENCEYSMMRPIRTFTQYE